MSTLPLCWTFTVCVLFLFPLEARLTSSSMCCGGISRGVHEVGDLVRGHVVVAPNCDLYCSLRLRCAGDYRTLANFPGTLVYGRVPTDVKIGIRSGESHIERTSCARDVASVVVTFGSRGHAEPPVSSLFFCEVLMLMIVIFRFCSFRPTVCFHNVPNS